MPQSFSQTIRNSFNKGLLTEYSELNFPNEASVDELNCALFKAGNRTKRLGLEYELNFNLTDEEYAQGLLFGTEDWDNVGSNSDVDFVVVQTGQFLRFYQKGSGLSSNIVPVSSTNDSPYILDMSQFNRDGGEGAGASHVNVASIEGRLVVASPQINTFYIERDTDTLAFTVTQIEFKIRDFEYQRDRLDLTMESVDSSPGPLRRYDTANTGWTGTKGEAALATYTASSGGNHPPLTHPWYSGKDSSGNFSLTEWNNVYPGNTLIVNGHYILDLFEKDRGEASGITTIPSEITKERFSAVASFAGRVFYAGVDSKVYFSRILEDFSDIGNCYQVNDPTSEEISDLLDTDGGFISIPDASGIKALHAFGASLLVFADNGVWRIQGVDNVFRASEYSVYRITEDGLSARKSLTFGENDVPFWWSYTGIHTIEVTDQGGMIERNISRDTIQTFWREIDGDSRAAVRANYDGLNNVIVWSYPSNDETITSKLNRMLLLDIDLGAFFPWEVSDTESDTPYVVGATFFKGKGSEEQNFTVIDEDGNTVVDGSGNTVVSPRETGTISSSGLLLLVRDPSGSLTFANFRNTEYLDWGEMDYEAYAEAAYNFMGDLSRKKNAPFITVFMRTTEEGYEEQEDGSFELINPSSLLVSGFWDFRKLASSSTQEAYRFKHPLFVDGEDPVFDYPSTVISTRLKMRGRGRVLKVRFEGVEGKGFNLLGWETLDARNPRY